MFRYLVLGLLREGTARHGYALMKEYRARSGVHMSTGNFYRELQRLGGLGLAQMAQNPEGADSRRAPYEITGVGRKAFDEWLIFPDEEGFANHEDGLSARALFVANAEPSAVRKMFDHWNRELWIRCKLLERERDAVSGPRGIAASNGFDSRRVLLARRIKHVAADIEFLDELRNAYETWLAGEGERNTLENKNRAGSLRRSRTPREPSTRR